MSEKNYTGARIVAVTMLTIVSLMCLGYAGLRIFSGGVFEPSIVVVGVMGLVIALVMSRVGTR